MSNPNINLPNLDSRYPTRTYLGIVDVGNSSGDVAAITAAISAQTTGGKPTGSFRGTQGKIARISTPTTITLGYSNTQAANWATDATTEKFRLSLDILPDAKLGSALTIRGGYGVELDINVLGGGACGTVTDAAISTGSLVVTSPLAIAAGVTVGSVVFITGAGPSPEGIVQPLAASVRSVNAGAGTFTLSEAAQASVSGATLNWYDVALRLEDCVGLKLNVYGKGFQGYLIGADATDDITKRLRSCEFPTIISNGCAGSLFWKSIDAFGSMGHIMSNTIYGDYIGQASDLHWDHWEGGVPQPTTQNARAYLWFDRCGSLNNLSVSVGDRSTEAAVLMTGNAGSNVGSMGRFSQIRCTMYQAVGTGATITSGSNQVTTVVSSALSFKVGQTITGAGIPSGTTITAVSGTGNGYTVGSPGTIMMSATATASSTNQAIYGSTSDGLKMIGITGITITHLDTARAINGLHIIGGGSVGIKILNHKSVTSDVTPVLIEGGATGTPRVDIAADYRFHLGYSATLLSTLLAGTDVRLSGYIEGAHTGDGGSTGKYAAQSASTATILDIAGLHQKSMSGLTGFIDPTTVTLRGVPFARLDNQVPTAGQAYQTDGSGGYTLTPQGASALVVQTVQNTVSNTATSTGIGPYYTIPANSVQLGTTYRVQAWGSVDNDASNIATIRLRLGGASGNSIASAFTVTNTTAKTLQSWNLDYMVVFRAAASTTTSVNVGGLAYSGATAGAMAQGTSSSTSVNMTVARDMGLDVTWTTASPTSILRCEGLIITKVN